LHRNHRGDILRIRKAGGARNERQCRLPDDQFVSCSRSLSGASVAMTSTA
jgi:hypothetical protein